MRIAEAKQVKDAIEKNKGNSGPDWDKLRKLHRDKMNGNASTN